MVHWQVRYEGKDVPACDSVLRPGDTMLEITTPFDPNALKLTCEMCSHIFIVECQRD